MSIREKRVKAGKWRTLEWFVNSKATGTFQLPAGARIKVRYGVGWFGKDRQKQTLDGRSLKTLKVGRWAITRARMQIKVDRETTVAYDISPGDVAVTVPLSALGRKFDR